jgi:DNA-binding NarL/FixJ family response regulator
MRPLLVLHPPAAQLGPLIAQLATEWTLVSGWTLPRRPWNAGKGLVCLGSLGDATDAQAALLAAARGAGVVAVARCSGDELDAFVDDLARLGTVEELHAETTLAPSEEQRLLELLAEGLSLDDAAAALHISRRTAERRLACARRALGVRTTAAAVASVSRS